MHKYERRQKTTLQQSVCPKAFEVNKTPTSISSKETTFEVVEIVATVEISKVEATIVGEAIKIMETIHPLTLHLTTKVKMAKNAQDAMLQTTLVEIALISRIYAEIVNVMDIREKHAITNLLLLTPRAMAMAIVIITRVVAISTYKTSIA